MSGELPSSEEEVQALLESAVSRRASHIRNEAETITMANVRRLLESDLGVEKSALDAHKAIIRQLVDAVLLSSENAEAEDEEPVLEEEPKRKKSSGKKKAREENGQRLADPTEETNSVDLQEKDYEEASKRKRQKKEKAKKEDLYKTLEDEDSGGNHPAASVSISEEEVHLEAPQVKSKKSKSRKEKEEFKEPQENGGGSQSDMSEESDVSERRTGKKGSSKVSNVKPVQNKRIEHLKKVIKACGLTIPPQIYKRAKQQPEDKHDKYLIKELEDMLSRHGLSSDPSEKEIKAAKRKIAREKDLEGIDTTNIILEPRGRRAASQLFAPVYNPPPVEYDSELDDEGEQDEEDESDNAAAANGSEDEGDLAAADDTDNSE